MKIWLYITNDVDNHKLVNISRLSQTGCIIEATAVDGRETPIAFFKDVKEATIAYKNIIEYIKNELKFTTRENLFIDVNISEMTLNSKPLLKEEQKQQKLNEYELVM